MFVVCCCDAYCFSCVVVALFVVWFSSLDVCCLLFRCFVLPCSLRVVVLFDA